MKTRSLFTEFLFNLAPHNKIGLSLKEFGVKDDESSVIAITYDKYEINSSDNVLDAFQSINLEQTDLPNFEAVKREVEGECKSLSEIDNLKDMKAITKLYKLTAEEIKMVGMGNSCISRMATKEFAWNDY